MGLISCNANPDKEVILVQFAGVVAEISLTMEESRRVRSQLELAERRLYNQLAVKRIRAWHEAQAQMETDLVNTNAPESDDVVDGPNGQLPGA